MASLSFSLCINPSNPLTLRLLLVPPYIFMKGPMIFLYATHLWEILPPFSSFKALRSTTSKYDCLSLVIWEVSLSSYPNTTNSLTRSNSIFGRMNKSWNEWKIALIPLALSHSNSILGFIFQGIGLDWGRLSNPKWIKCMGRLLL
jgi:hypothetical protein